jgi:hypothetical protein
MNGPEGLTGSINYAFRTERNEPPWFFNVYAGNMGRFEANAMHRIEISPRSWYTGFVHGSAQTGIPDMNHDGFSDVPAGRKILIGNHFQTQQEKYEMQAGLNLVNDQREAGQIVRKLHHPYTNLPYVFSQHDRKAEGFVKLGIFLNEETESSLGNIAAFQIQNLDADFGDSTLYRGQQRSYMYNFFFQRERSLNNFVDWCFLGEGHEHDAASFRVGEHLKYVVCLSGTRAGPDCAAQTGGRLQESDRMTCSWGIEHDEVGCS